MSKTSYVYHDCLMMHTEGFLRLYAEDWHIDDHDLPPDQQRGTSPTLLGSVKCSEIRLSYL